MTQIRLFELELADLRRALVAMGSVAEQSVALAVQAIHHPVVEAREQARQLEHRLDEMETAIEDRCHQIIALQSPLARDLRLLISAMRITSDLESIGDLAESVTKRAHYIARHQLVANPPDLASLGETVQRMTSRTMESFISGNRELARAVVTEEDQADALTKKCYEYIQASMVRELDRIKEYTHLLRAVGHLEHIADLAVSIAEETVYLHRGTIVRHHHEEMP